jgi:hypothetical protein
MRWVGVAAVGLVLSACGGDDDDAGTGGGGGGGPPPTSVTVSGAATFDFVPAGSQGLDYARTQARPIRGATVEIISGTTVLATTKADANGAYSVSVAPNTSAFVRVKAELVQSGGPSFDFRVVDNVNANALYALDGPTFNTGTAASTQNVHAASGWGTTSYTGPRSAAPFAILDTVYTAVQTVLAADATAAFAPLRVHWSTANRPVLGANGAPNPSTGEIGTSFFSPSVGGIFLLGAADIDTEEYDRHVIVHEWGHYFEDAFSRSDNFGGRHTLGDRLDLRVAFSEGFSTGLAGIVLADPFYRDTQGQRQAQVGAINIEGGAQVNPGWYSEQSVLEAVYDLVDTASDPADGLSMSFAAVYNAMRNGHVTAVSPGSIFTFVNALKAANPGSAQLIDALVASQSISAVVDEYGTNETNDANGAFPEDVLPIYTPIAVNNPTAVNVCSTNEFTSTTGAATKLGSRRYLRFDVGATATHTFSAVATSIPAGEQADPDLVLHRSGPLAVSECPVGPNCSPPAGTCGSATPANCSETFSRSLTPGRYVLEVYEWTNTEDDAQFPPIGRTCFDVRVTQP